VIYYLLAGLGDVALEWKDGGLTGGRARQIVCDRTRPIMKMSLGELSVVDRTLSDSESGRSEVRVRSSLTARALSLDRWDLAVEV
jgi:hypothetical protein